MKSGKKVVFLSKNIESQQLFTSLSADNVLIAHNPEQVIRLIEQILV